jgi:pimeloyl-ACP methyl ester carboxylesterase
MRKVVHSAQETLVNPNLVEEIASSAPPPVEELFASVDGARMRYLRVGSGPPLILLHGLMGYSFSWRFTIPVVARHATVYAVDQLGTGFSDRPAGLDCHLRAAADRILRFIEAVGLSSFNLLGTSHGGAVAMMAASMCVRREDVRLRKLILVAPVNPWSAHGRRLAPFLGSRIGSALFLRTIPRMPWTFPLLLARLYADSQRIPPGTLAGYAAPASRPGTFEYAVSVASHWTEDLQELETVIPLLAEVSTLLIWGAADPAVYVESAEKLRSHFKHCDLAVYPGVGHLPYEEAPEQFNSTLVDFLTRTDGREPNHP